jgi:hypothetical protein
MKRYCLALVAVTFLAVVGSSPYSHSQSQTQVPCSAHSRADETLDMWNKIGNKLIAMAQDFLEDKYDFRLQKGQRSSAQNLLNVAGVNYDLMRSLSRSKFGAEFANNPHNPPRDVYKTKADVVKLIQQAVADGAALIQQQGEAGLDKTTKFAWGTGWSTTPTSGCSSSSTAA